MMEKRRVKRLAVYDVAGRGQVDAEILLMDAALTQDHDVDHGGDPHQHNLGNEGGTNPAKRGRRRGGPGRGTWGRHCPTITTGRRGSSHSALHRRHGWRS